MLTLVFLIIVLSKSQILQPIGKCLGACRNCKPKQLTTCSGTRQNMCLPGYVPNFNTASCQLNSMYKNQITSLADFLPNEDLSAWSDITNSICQYKTPSGQSKKISVLGTYNRQFSLKRNYPLIKPFKIMIFNFNLIRDSWTPFNDFLLITIKAAGKMIRSFQISVEIRTPISPEANPIVCFGKNVLNEARTVTIKVPQGNATDLQIQFNSQLSSSATWGITNTRMIYGCGQYSLLNPAGDKCEICENFQFFPEIINKVMIGCKKCPIECLKCTDFSTCQECQKGFELSSNFCVKKNISNIVQLKQFISGNGKKCVDNFTFIKGTRQQKIEMIPDSPLKSHNRFSAIFTLVYNEAQWSQSTVLNLFLKTKHQKIKILDIKKINLTSKAINTCVHLANYHSLLTFSSNKIPIYFDPKQPYQIDFQIENTNANASTSLLASNIQFGINDIRILYEQCGGTNCLLCGPEDQCTACVGMYPLNKELCQACPQGYGGKDCQQCSIFCRTCDSLKITNCLSCNQGYNLIGQSCLPENFTIFPVQKQFSPNSQQPAKAILCGSEISFLTPKNRKLSARLILPSHNGLILGIKFYRVKEWSGKAEIFIDEVLVQKKDIISTVGGILCKDQTLGFGKDMSYIYTYRNQTHDKTESIFELSGDGQLAIAQFVVLLKNCASCGSKNQTEKTKENLPKQRQSTLPPFPIFNQSKIPQVDLLPQTLRETSTSTSTGIEVKMDLNYPYRIDFNVTIDKLSPKDQQITSYEIVNTQHFFFVKVNQSFTNGMLQISGWVPFQRQAKGIQGNQGQQRNTPRNLQNQQTTVLKNILLRRKIIERFDVISLKQTDPMQGLSIFLTVISWIAIIGYIIAVPFSYGVIFEDLIINLQTVFLLIYINPEFLPFSLSKSLAGLERMENLDFLIENHYAGISTWWLGNVSQNTPLYLTQFKIDLNFIRAFIPIILVNVVFVFWFIFAALLNRKLENDIDKNQRKITKFTNIVHNIGGRPINYFDQIFRIQFMTTVWLSLIQFKNLSYPQGSDRSQVINIIICISSLVISLVWLAFVFLFTKYQQKKLALTFFTEIYQDIFYTKSSLVNYPTIHTYLSNLFRYASFFCLALAAAFMNTQPVLWLALSIMLNISFIIYSWKIKIYTDKFAFFLRIVDSIVLIFIFLLMIVIFGVGDQMHKDGYFVLGYLTVSFAILIIVNGFARVLYFGYMKITDLMHGMKDQSQFVKPVDTQRIV